MENQTQATAVVSVLGAIFAFALVLVLAWLCTRFIAGRYGVHGNRGGSVEVIERTAIGPDKSLVIVRTAGKVLLLGVTSHQINALGELDPAKFEGVSSAPGEAVSFSAALSGALGMRRKQEQEKGNQDE